MPSRNLSDWRMMDRPPRGSIGLMPSRPLLVDIKIF